MQFEIDLGPYSNVDYVKICKWINEYKSNYEKFVIALQFSSFDVKYAPRIQYVLNQEINLQSNIQNEHEKISNVKFVIICDFHNPSCCIDRLNIKKSHSNLLIHFGYCCYYNLKQMDIPLIFVKKKDIFLLNEVQEHTIFQNIFDFIQNFLQEYKMKYQHLFYKFNVIFSFENAFSENLYSILIKMIESENSKKTNVNIPILFYLVSHIENTNEFLFKENDFICDLCLIKLCHNEDLKVNDLNFSTENISKSFYKKKTFFFHFTFKDDFDKIGNSFIERVYLKYSEFMEFKICNIDKKSDLINVDDDYIKYLDNFISKRFLAIEKSLSITGVNRIGFVITPGITKNEWELINYYRTFKYRKESDTNNKIYIETYIVAFTGVSEVKFRNLSNIEIFCYFGCCEYFVNYILKTLKLKHPIILNPFEYEIYLGIRTWSTTYLDNNELYNYRKNDIQKLLELKIDDSCEFSETEVDINTTPNYFENLKVDQIEIKRNLDIQNFSPNTKKVLFKLHNIKSTLEKKYFGLNPVQNTEDIPLITQGRNGLASFYLNEINM